MSVRVVAWPSREMERIQMQAGSEDLRRLPKMLMGMQVSIVPLQAGRLKEILKD